jgi:transposase
MLTVDHYARIRQLRRDGLSIRQIADQLNHSPKTILKALANPEPAPAIPVEPRAAPVFGPFRAAVDAILAADENAPRKQRHTAMQIYRRLVEEHDYTGGYDQVRRYLKQRRLDTRETFLPLEHRPGVRAEADFGHIHADFPEGRRQIPVLIVTWSYSNAPFAIALPTERTEAILHGLVEAFTFFGCVPVELWWDNPKTVAVRLFRGRDRALHPRYAALASHYPFTPKFVTVWSSPFRSVQGFGGWSCLDLPGSSRLGDRLKRVVTRDRLVLPSTRSDGSARHRGARSRVAR